MPHSKIAAISASPHTVAWSGFFCTALLGTLLVNFLIADGHDWQRCVELVLLLAGTFRIILNNEHMQTWSIGSYNLYLPVFVFFALGFVSALTAWSPRHAVYEWSSILLLTLLIHMVRAEVARTSVVAIERILQGVSIVCLLYSLRVLLMYAAALANGYQIDMHGLAIGFSNMRFLNHTQTALLPLLVLAHLRAPACSLSRRACFAMGAFWWSLLYVGEARASLLALAAGSMAVLVMRGHHAHAFLKAMAMMALAGCVAYILLFVLLPQWTGLHPIGDVGNLMERSASDPASGRQFLWSRAVQLIAAHPWFGVGPLHFAHDGADLNLGAHPHDWILQVAVEWGVPALLCLLGVIGAGLRALLRAGRSLAPADLRQQQTCAMFLVAISAIIVDALFSGVFVMPQSRLAAVLVIGCAAGWVQSLAPPAGTGSARAITRHATAMLALLAACLLAWSVAPGLAEHARHAPLGGAERAANPDIHWPRMWEAGYF